MAKKLPHIPFYVGDFLKEPSVMSATAEDVGIWMLLLYAMWGCERRGYLCKPSGKPYTDQEVAAIARIDVDRLTKWKELELHRVGEHGEIYSSRMAHDGDISEIRSEAGKLGGRGNTKAKAKLKQTSDIDNDNDNKPKKKKNSKFNRPNYSDGFEQAWKAYPDKTGKPEAFIAWKEGDCESEVDEVIAHIKLCIAHKWQIGRPVEGADFKPNPKNGVRYFKKYEWRDGWQPEAGSIAVNKSPEEESLLERKYELDHEVSLMQSKLNGQNDMLKLLMRKGDQEATEKCRLGMVSLKNQMKKLVTQQRTINTKLKNLRGE